MQGWPGSIWEFSRNGGILELLNDSGGVNVVAPCLVGFGWSTPAASRGHDIFAMARRFLTLMHSLGYQNYIVQGGDWGAIIAEAMAAVAPQGEILGMHTNFPSAMTPASLATAAQVLMLDGPLEVVCQSSDVFYMLGVVTTNIYEEKPYI
eukprot:m.734727 g.734727  ORF g.734727 m.734727 type:complete len:150 (+) comp23085_c0_seq20:1030-1479(+)